MSILQKAPHLLFASFFFLPTFCLLFPLLSSFPISAFLPNFCLLSQLLPSFPVSVFLPQLLSSFFNFCLPSSLSVFLPCLLSSFPVFLPQLPTSSSAPASLPPLLSLSPVATPPAVLRAAFCCLLSLFSFPLGNCYKCP